MGVLRGLSRVFRAKDQNNGASTAVLDRPSDAGVAIELTGPIGDVDSTTTGVMSRKEVITELQKNYSEVLDLVRKVDQHLDEQERRGEEMMALVERTTQAVEALPVIRDQNAQLVDSVGAFTEAVSIHQEAVNVSIDRQASAIEAHTGMLDGFNQQVRDSIGGMSDSTDRLGGAIAQMRDADLRRERELTELVTRSQRGMLAIIIASAVLVGGTLLALLLFVLR